MNVSKQRKAGKEAVKDAKQLSFWLWLRRSYPKQEKGYEGELKRAGLKT